MQKIDDIGSAYSIWEGTCLTTEMEDRVCSTVWIKVVRFKILWQVYILGVLNFLEKLPEGIIILCNPWTLSAL
jgi:hypothetical protein